LSKEGIGDNKQYDASLPRLQLDLLVKITEQLVLTDINVWLSIAFPREKMPPRPQGRRPEPENNGVSKLRKIVYNINNDVMNCDNYNNNFNRSSIKSEQ